MGALAQEVFMYKGWECTVISTNSDDVRRQADDCQYMSLEALHVNMLLLEVDPARHVDGKTLGVVGELDPTASWALSI